jgi:hypothetical protein
MNNLIGRCVRLIALLVTGSAVLLVASGCDRPDTRPRQPVAFSHKTHAGDNAISCQYCHSGVRRGAAAGIPSVRLCMGCHQLVAANRPEIISLRETFQNRKPIPWMRVNVIGDFVYFNHYPHIARGVQCQTCHGEVRTMNEVWPVVNLADMAFCVDCHREHAVSVDCYTCHR